MFIQAFKNRKKYVYIPAIILKLDSGVNYISLQGTKTVCLDSVE